MKMLLLLMALLFLVSGCSAAIAPSMQMSRDAKIFIFDVSENGMFNPDVNSTAISRKIIGNTAQRLEKNHIIVTNDLSGNAANLKFDIKSISGIQPDGFSLPGGNNIEIQYRVTFEGINGAKLFVYDTRQSGRSVNEVCDSIVGKVVGMVLRYYAE